MSLFQEFTGPAYRTRSATIAADVCMNLYPERVPGHVKQSVLYGTPGLKFYASGTTSATGTRGVWSQDGRTFRVVGAVIEEINTTTKVVTNRGAIADDGLLVSLVGNGRGGEQLMIVGGGQVKIFNLTTNTLSASISLPLTNLPVMGAFMDGYFLLLEANTIRVWFSALEDGTSWNALNFFARSHVSDNLVGIAVLHDRLFLLGQQATEIFYNSGDLNLPFIPYPGTIMEEGASTPWGILVLGEALYWLAEDNLGRGRMVRANAYSPETVSTPAIGFTLAQYTTLADAEALAYSQEGHDFICWTFPSSGETWCFDATEGAWHQRATWNQTSAMFTRWRARTACSTPAGIMVGLSDGSAICTLDLDTFGDADAPRKWLRRAPYISAENQWLFLDQVELGAQVGVGLNSGQGILAQVMLRISRDAATSWTDTIFGSVGAIGNALARCVWRHLGRSRSDRLVLEISQTDPVRPVWGPGLWIRATAGSNQL